MTGWSFPALLLAAALGWAPAAVAQTLFSEDFQAGSAAQWRAGGDGDVRLTTYAGNISMRLTKRAYAVARFALPGAGEVTASASFAAQNLGKGEACRAEISVDGGNSWARITALTDGQDDGVTLQSGSVTVAVAKGIKVGVIGLRAVADGKKGTCWADNIQVTGRKVADTTNAPPTRQALTAAFLIGAGRFDELVDYAAFAPAKGAGRPSNHFSGRLIFEAVPGGAGFEVVDDAPRYENSLDPADRVPPPFDFELVQVGGRLAPARRGLNQTGEHAWEWIIEPGHVWDEPGDGGFSRAAIPFALQERNANCTHNGVLTFLFKSTGEVSRVAYQIAQETCLYFKFNAWGMAAARFVPGAVAGAAAIGEALTRELDRRLATRPIAEIARDHPGLDAGRFGAPSDVSPENMTVYGVVLDGVHYVGGCDTRAGIYAYCDEMDLPSYSTAKTLVAGLGFMRLALLDPDIRNARVTDYVPACATAGDWDGVTFEHALDMATGRYQSVKREVDENKATTHRFFVVPDHAAKIRIACTRYPRKAKPGKTWVYHTSDSYILGAAMQAWWRRDHGPEADFFADLVADDIFRPLGLSPTLQVTRRTYDAAAQPFTGWGLTYLRDDIARLGVFLARDMGKLDGKPLIEPGLAAAALQRDPGDPGLPAGGKDMRYNNGVWAWNMQGYLGCAEPAWIPFMSGFGGISVVMLPGGAVYYYFSDGGEFKWAHAAAELNKVQPFCRK